MMNGNASIVGESELLFSYGRHTPWFNVAAIRSYEDAMPQKPTLGNHWSSTENSSNNSWNVNFNSGKHLEQHQVQQLHCAALCST